MFVLVQKRMRLFVARTSGKPRYTPLLKEAVKFDSPKAAEEFKHPWEYVCNERIVPYEEHA